MFTKKEIKALLMASQVYTEKMFMPGKEVDIDLKTACDKLQGMYHTREDSDDQTMHD